MAATIVGEGSIDTSDVVRFARANLEAAGITKAEFGKGLRAAGMAALPTAKALASWSQRIPGTIKVSGGVTGVKLKAGGDNAPHAKVYEVGSKGNRGQVRHPIWGEWYPNVKYGPTRPYMRPAILAHRATIERETMNVVNTVLRKAGYR